jgi:uncharacterized protein YjbI with pentapeptide repeats
MSETFENCNMAGVVFHNVNLEGAVFDDVNLAGASIHNANLGNFTIDDAYIKGLTIFGFRVDQLIEAELDRRDPDRARLRMADCFDPVCVWAVLEHLGEVRAGFSAFLRSTDPSRLSARPDPENWSAIENLRHLIFAEDLYLNRWLLQNNEPWCKLGLRPAFLADNPDYVEVGSQPSEDVEILLAAWEAIHSRMMAYVATVPAEELRRDTSKIDFGQGTVGKILQTLARHDLEHIRQAEAAVATLSQSDGR